MKFLVILKIIYLLLLFGVVNVLHGDASSIQSNDGVDIHFIEKGSGEPALVFVHGWCCDKSYWNHQISYFSKNYRVIAVDLAGHGDSGFDRNIWSISAFGTDVVSVVDSLKINQAILIGHSMGGMVILETAQKIPDKILGLIGVDTFHDVEAEYSQQEFDQFLFQLKSNFKETTKNFVRGMFTADADSQLVSKIVEDMSNCRSITGIGAMEEYFKYDMAAAFEKFNKPIVSINSDKWPTNTEAGKRHAKSFELKLMPGFGHFIMLEAPDRFNQILEVTVAEMVK